MRERLTHKVFGSEAYIYDDCIHERPFTCENKICYEGKAIDRLAAYEDSGLSPEEVVEIKKYLNMWIEICKENNVSIVQFKKWAEAEQDGRLIILPCKVGDVVYMLTENKTTKEDIIDEFSSIKIKTLDLWCFDISQFGKTVFLTREEAEKALEEGLR